MRLPRTLLATILLAFAASVLPTAPSFAANLPISEERIGDAQQVIIVTASSWKATEGTLATYEKRGGQWSLVQAPIRAQLGYGGMVKGSKRRQGTGATPTGVYEIVNGFGRQANPGTALDYVQVDRNDAWTYNPRVPSTYNVFQTVDRSWKSYGGYVEHLWDMGYQYDYVAVLDYNLPSGPIRTGANGVRRSDGPPSTRRGGGIFLHVDNGNKTAGCIAIDKRAMREVMQWLNPKRDPVIVIRVD